MQEPKQSQSHKQKDERAVSRRTALKGITGFGAGILLAGSGCSDPIFEAEEDIQAGPSTVIPRENRKEGTQDWLLNTTRTAPRSRHRSPYIEGYCSHTSIRARERIRFYISTRPTSGPVQVDLYRMGYYGGLGARHVLSAGPIWVKPQPTPAPGERRLRACKWEPALELTISPEWVSGIYLAKLTSLYAKAESYLIFIVKDDRAADFVFQCSDTTWQAYNKWPKHCSLYDYPNKRDYWGPDVEVSFDRPYSKYTLLVKNRQTLGSGEWFLWEYPLAYWMESLGYDVTYVSALDTHSEPSSLKRAKGFLSVGHDEYYTLEMYNNLQQAIKTGLNVAFLSGNTCCGRVELKPNSEGVPNRILRRIDRFGPKSELEIRYFPERAKFPWSSPNEALLVGARSTHPMEGSGSWTCSKPNHWLFEGAGMQLGDSIPRLVGYECQTDPAPIPGLEIVAEGITKGPRGPGAYTSTLYPGPKGNFVFNASSIWWSSALAAPPGFVRPAYPMCLGPEPDGRAQQITANLLNRMRAPLGPQII
jgi:hypothetical protein